MSITVISLSVKHVGNQGTDYEVSNITPAQHSPATGSNRLCMVENYTRQMDNKQYQTHLNPKQAMTAKLYRKVELCVQVNVPALLHPCRKHASMTFLFDLWTLAV
jgi:hypothetical protein